MRTQAKAIVAVGIDAASLFVTGRGAAEVVL